MQGAIGEWHNRVRKRLSECGIDVNHAEVFNRVSSERVVGWMLQGPRLTLVWGTRLEAQEVVSGNGRREYFIAVHERGEDSEFLHITYRVDIPLAEGGTVPHLWDGFITDDHPRAFARFTSFRGSGMSTDDEAVALLWIEGVIAIFFA